MEGDGVGANWMDDWTNTLAGYGWLEGQTCESHTAVCLFPKLKASFLMMKVLHCSWALYDIQETYCGVSSREFLLLTFYATFRRHFWNTFKCRARLQKVPWLLQWRSINTPQFSIKISLKMHTWTWTKAWYQYTFCTSIRFLGEFQASFASKGVTNFIHQPHVYCKVLEQQS